MWFSFLSWDELFPVFPVVFESSLQLVTVHLSAILRSTWGRKRGSVLNERRWVDDSITRCTLAFAIRFLYVIYFYLHIKMLSSWSSFVTAVWIHTSHGHGHIPRTVRYIHTSSDSWIIKIQTGSEFC